MSAHRRGHNREDKESWAVMTVCYRYKVIGKKEDVGEQKDTPPRQAQGHIGSGQPYERNESGFCYSAITIPPIALFSASAGSPLRRDVREGCLTPRAAPTIRRAESPMRGGVTFEGECWEGGVTEPRAAVGSMFVEMGEGSLPVAPLISGREELIRALRVG